MIQSMFTWSDLNVMNTYVDNICIYYDDTNTQEENLPPQLPFPCTKIYSVIIPGIIIYVNTSQFIILFVDVVHE